MEILTVLFESFSLSSETMLFLLPFIVIFYYAFSLFGYKKFFLVLVGLGFFLVLSQFSLLALVLLIGLSIVNFILLRISQLYHSQILLYFAFFLNLSSLILLKYIPETPTILNDISHFVGFIGVSFYIFHVWSIFMDIHTKKIIQPINFMTFMSYLLYFPKMITGPLVRYNDFEKELLKETINETFVMEGVALFLYGMIIKAVADYVALYPTNIYANPQGYGGFEHLSAMYGYALYIFLDFSAYTNMARGISRLFGIELPINFNSPYRATSIIDFWRRWHMSLSKWILDYIYIPLGGSKKGAIKMYFNLFIAFLLSGFWHGVGLHFAIWGVIHGVGIIINKFFTTLKLSIPTMIAWFITFHWVVLGWIFFANPIDEALISLSKIWFEFDIFTAKDVILNNLNWFILLPMGLLFSLWDNTILIKWMEIFTRLHYTLKVFIFWLILWLILISHQGKVNTFIYQNF